MFTLLILFLIFRALCRPWRPWGMWYRPWGMWGGMWRRPPMGGFGGPGRGFGRF